MHIPRSNKEILIKKNKPFVSDLINHQLESYIFHLKKELFYFFELNFFNLKYYLGKPFSNDENSSLSLKKINFLFFKLK